MDVMEIAIWKQEKGRWFEHSTQYDTVQLLTPYADLLRNSAEEARDVLEQYMADVVVEFSRMVDGAFLPASHAPAPPVRVRGSDSS